MSTGHSHRTPLASTLALVAAGALLPVGVAVAEHVTQPASSTALAAAPAGSGATLDSTGSTGASGVVPGAPGSTGSGSTGSGSTGSASGTDGAQGVWPGAASDGQQWPGSTQQLPGGRAGRGWGQAAMTTEISGTPVASAKGVVLIDTELPGGEGKGTGITLTSDGTILTNYHVVEGSTKITVQDSTSGKSFSATVVGHDATHDIAVLRLEGASGLSTAVLNESTATVGTQVTAIGQGGGQGTLYAAAGTITATDQRITAGDETGSAEALTGLLETSADVVPGYSGGPLVDADGKVVGVDTAASSGGDIDGYAVPIAQAKDIVDQILAGERSETVHVGARGGLGISVASSAQVAGAGVLEVTQGSAADEAGITAGSVITTLDGRTLSSATDLTSALDGAYPGGRVTVGWTDAQGATHTKTFALGTSAAN